MNVKKINEYIQKEYSKQLEVTLTNISIHYNINKKDLFEKFLYKRSTNKAYKNKKKLLDKQYICMSRKQDGGQCSRSKKYKDYCGKHSLHKNKCPKQGYIHDASRNKEEEQEYIKSNKFVCICKPRGIGRIYNELISISSNSHNTNSILVESEIINGVNYHVENNTQIIFDTNVKHPTVLGKKLSENNIFFISEEDSKYSTDTILIPETNIPPDNQDNQDNQDKTLDIPINSISNIINKHNLTSIDDKYNEFDEFNINTHITPHTLCNEDDNEDDREQDEDTVASDILDDINNELGLY